MQNYFNTVRKEQSFEMYNYEYNKKGADIYYSNRGCSVTMFNHTSY